MKKNTGIHEPYLQITGSYHLSGSDKYPSRATAAPGERRSAERRNLSPHAALGQEQTTEPWRKRGKKQRSPGNEAPGLLIISFAVGTRRTWHRRLPGMAVLEHVGDQS
jgi:hypothetical protein